MAKKHLTNVFGAAAATPQTEQADPQQVKNNAGGYSFQLGDFDRLARFLVLGTEGGTYYVSESKLTRDNAKSVERCIKADGKKTVDTIVEISTAGRAPKNDYALFALAMCASYGDQDTKAYALANLNKVARIGTHLFHFVEYIGTMRGMGRSIRRAIGNWYSSRPTDKLAYQLVKYQSRDGWSHDDLLRMAHPDTSNNSDLHELMQWVTEGWDTINNGHAMVNIVTNMDALKQSKGRSTAKTYGKYDLAVPDALRFVEGFELAKRTVDSNGKVNVASLVKLIGQYGLTREMIPTQGQKHAEVWEALLEKMPYTAMIRNLANMTRCGLVAPNSDATIKVVQRLSDSENLRKARVHPIQILAALTAYDSSKQNFGMWGSAYGLKSKGDPYTAVDSIVNALDDAYYLSFDFVPKTNKRYMIGQDVSGSMGSPVSALPTMSCLTASAALAMVTARVEPFLFWGGFSTSFVKLDLNAKMRLDAVMKRISGMSFGGTDCAQPMIYALKNKMPVDVFAIYTDNETWAGSQHPHEALRTYRDKMKIDAKMVVIGMTSTGFTIADPKDSGMLDVVGFDTNTPSLMSDFVSGGATSHKSDE